MFVFVLSYEEENSGSLVTRRLISVLVSLLKGSCLGAAFEENFFVGRFDSVGTQGSERYPWDPSSLKADGHGRVREEARPAFKEPTPCLIVLYLFGDGFCFIRAF